MNGRTEKTRTYYACQGRSRRDADKPWHEEHPACVRVRENALNDAVHEFFATRIFGPDRQQLLAASMAELDSGDSAEQERQQRTMALRKLIKDLRVRQDRLLDELETPPEDMDEETYRAFRQRLHERFADLTKQLKVCQEELDQLAAQPAQKGRQNAGLLDRLPRISDQHAYQI